MKKHFYSEVISLEVVVTTLDELAMSPKEKEHLTLLAEEMLHHKILDMVLTELNEEDKKVFLLLLLDESHDQVWEHLTGKIEDLHTKLKSVAKEIEESLLEDIRKLTSH